MQIGNIAKIFGSFVRDNSPTILTVIGVSGTVSTAILTGRASYRAAEVIRDAETHPFEEGDGFWIRKSNKERLELVWKLYIPPVLVGGATVACIIGGNTISSRRTTALMSAFTIAETSFREYKDKVVEQIGINQETKVRDAVAIDRASKNPVETAEVIITGDGEYLFHDSYSGRYFESNIEKIRKVQNDLNQQLLNGSNDISLNDFYTKIGIERLRTGDDVGWNSTKMIDVKFTSGITGDGRPYIVITFEDDPFPKYYRVWG